jgi:hypothetical protein
MDQDPDMTRAKARVLRLLLALDLDDEHAWRYALRECCCPACASQTVGALCEMTVKMLNERGAWHDSAHQELAVLDQIHTTK